MIFLAICGCKWVNCDEMDGDRPRLPANRNCHGLSRVSWALTQISCFFTFEFGSLTMCRTLSPGNSKLENWPDICRSFLLVQPRIYGLCLVFSQTTEARCARLRPSAKANLDGSRSAQSEPRGVRLQGPHMIVYNCTILVRCPYCSKEVFKATEINNWIALKLNGF